MRDLEAILSVNGPLPVWLSGLEIVLTYAERADLDRAARKFAVEAELSHPKLVEALQAGLFGGDAGAALDHALDGRRLTITGTFERAHASLVTALLRGLVRSNHTNLGLIAAQSRAMDGQEDENAPLPLRFAHQVEAISLTCRAAPESAVLSGHPAHVFPLDGLMSPMHPDLDAAAKTGAAWDGSTVDLPAPREDAEEVGELLLDLASDGMFQVLSDLDIWGDDNPECFAPEPGRLRMDGFVDDAFALILLMNALQTPA